METTHKVENESYSPPDRSFEGPNLNAYYAYTESLQNLGEALNKETKANSEFKIIKGENSKVKNIAKSSFAIPIDQSNIQASKEIKDLIQFIKASPTSYHAGEASRRLCVEQNGFTELKENQPWKIVCGGKYFVSRDISTFIAFVMPTNKPESACILGAHTDSPGLKLKPEPNKKVDNASLLCPEIYGGPILPSWLGQGLGLAGRITYLNNKKEKECSLIDFEKTIAVIPYLAIHLERTQKEKVEINAQDHLPAVCWLQTEEDSPFNLEVELKKLVPISKLLSHELFFVPRGEPEIINGQLLHSQRLDNLLGTHASLCALLDSQTPEEGQIKAVICWDHEEVGSNSQNGASSNFLDSVLTRMSNASGLNLEEVAILKANSGLISIDVAHGRHPNYFGKHEPNNAPLLGKGPVIKHHASQSYATTSPTSAWIKQAGIQCNIPIQEFCIKSDTLCGSTIGNIAAPRLGIRTVDIGAPIWGMHAMKETGTLVDHLYMCRLLKELLSMNLSSNI
ncbi:MAG: M18 family aminopeptidase [Parachlamydiaceae bacterium]|nr:M18 family aminopeptidase [Parachlamydiaceae bacterium]